MPSLRRSLLSGLQANILCRNKQTKSKQTIRQTPSIFYETSRLTGVPDWVLPALGATQRAEQPTSSMQKGCGQCGPVLECGENICTAEAFSLLHSESHWHQRFSERGSLTGDPWMWRKAGTSKGAHWSSALHRDTPFLPQVPAQPRNVRAPGFLACNRGTRSYRRP